MNVVLETLFLRRPRIEYVCPPVCEAQFSGSGSPIIVLDEIGKLVSPTGGRAGGRGNVFFTWRSYPGQVCFSIYFEADPNNPASPYNLISECVPKNTIALCSAGSWQVSAITTSGESALSSPFITSGTGYAFIPLPIVPDTIGYNLYKNGLLYWYNFTGNAFEVCNPGCYRISAITTDGETPLSDPICTGSCPAQTCATGEAWSDILCECMPCGIADEFVTCAPGSSWDVAQCACVSSGGGTVFLSGCLSVPFGETIIAPVGFNSPCTFVGSGTLPTGLVFTQDTPLTASISGTPTQGGVFNYTVDITGGAPLQFAEFIYQITTFGITNIALAPEPQVGVPYSFQLIGEGGVPPYTFSLNSGLLPDGLTIDAAGLISGTPTTAGASTAVIKVEDAAAHSCLNDFNKTTTDCSGADWLQNPGTCRLRIAGYDNAVTFVSVQFCPSAKLGSVNPWDGTFSKAVNAGGRYIFGADPALFTTFGGAYIADDFILVAGGIAISPTLDGSLWRMDINYKSIGGPGGGYASLTHVGPSPEGVYDGDTDCQGNPLSVTVEAYSTAP